tara:strand:+ start:523 stop:876 length:354 start_codon:yes stop_codon:yes gene_type:complete
MNIDLRVALIPSIIRSFDNTPEGFSHGSTWESIIFPEGYEKPPKEAFEAKLQELIDAQPLVELRAERNKRLTECDYLAMSDYPHRDYEMKLKWLQYRQALRDLPSSADPQWPVAPSQ